MSDYIKGARTYTEFALHVHCAICGSILRIADPDAATKPIHYDGDGDYVPCKCSAAEGGFSVWPCEKCYGKAREAGELVKRLLNAVKEEVEK